jgi:hypothetical protein
MHWVFHIVTFLMCLHEPFLIYNLFYIDSTCIRYKRHRWKLVSTKLLVYILLYMECTSDFVRSYSRSTAGHVKQNLTCKNAG